MIFYPTSCMLISKIPQVTICRDSRGRVDRIGEAVLSWFNSSECVKFGWAVPMPIRMCTTLLTVTTMGKSYLGPYTDRWGCKSTRRCLALYMFAVKTTVRPVTKGVIQKTREYTRSVALY